MAYPCSDDPQEVIESIVEAQDNADKFDQFVNGGVLEEVQLGTGEPTPVLRNLVHLVKSAAVELDGSDVSGKFSDAANQGTVLRMLADHFGDFINLRDFGAVGDGTTDDTEAWTAWLDAVEESGGLGYAPAGNYKITETIDGIPTEVFKTFPYGSIGHHEEGFSEIKPGFTDRFANAIPIGQGHILDSTRTVTISNSTEGRSIYPTISINAKLDVPSNADPVTMNGQPRLQPDGTSTPGASLIASCHGIWVQHILTGGNENNRLHSVGISTNAVNDAKGDNDCSGIAARAQKTADAGMGDTAGLGGRVDTYSHQRGGCMGAEVVCHNNAGGSPCPSDYSNVSTSRWTTPLHVTGSGSGSPSTAAILIQGNRTHTPYWEGIEFSYTMFPTMRFLDENSDEDFTKTVSDIPEGFAKNEFLDEDGEIIEGYEDDTDKVQEYEPVIIDSVTVDGVQHSDVVRYRTPNTVAINMGSFSKSNGYPDTCIKMGHAKHHIWTPNQDLTIRAHGIDVRGGGSVHLKANSQYYIPSNSSTPIRGNAGLNFCVTSLDGSTTTTDASFYFNAETYSVALHNFASNMGLVFYKPNNSSSADDVAYFMPGMCTDYNDNNNEVVSKINLGSGYRRWENVYVKTSSFSDSDERIKQDVEDIPEAVLRAWGRVNFRQFKFKEAVAQKGSSARLHVGVIAQRVIEAFEAEGVDAFAYGLIGHDVQAAREAVYRDYDVQHEAERDEEGGVIREAWTEHRHELVSEAEPACDVYSIRYEEALALECAYQRWRLEQIEARLNENYTTTSQDTGE